MEDVMSMDATFFVKEFPVAKINKEDCISIQDVTTQLDISRASVYTYMNILRLQKYRFPFDRASYILKSDFERLKLFKEHKELS
jgi:biotin operon repressor